MPCGLNSLDCKRPSDVGLPLRTFRVYLMIYRIKRKMPLATSLVNKTLKNSMNLPKQDINIDNDPGKDGAVE